jgi:ATP-binding cassette subfamily F protein 3
MIRLQNLALHRGPRSLFENVDLTVHPGWKVGITGANGSGKSSLFALLRGLLPPDQGRMELPAAWRIAHVAQETPSGSQSALAWTLAGDEELAEARVRLQGAEGMQAAALHAHLEALDAYTAESRAAQLLHGLSFAPGEEFRPVDSFSGGWRMRLNLARALMSRADLLLLDEPTNHLDLDAVLWFESWLRRYPGTLLLISHDRDFLDNVCDHIVHIENQQMTLYSGDYTAFERRRAERLAQQQSAYARQQREIAHIRGFVDRFRAQATKARQAQSRLKALERMELVQAAEADSPFSFAFPPPDKCPNPLLSGSELSVGYPSAGSGQRPSAGSGNGKTVLSKISFTLVPGTRLGLLGRNGAGKSTLIKLLAGVLPPQSGKWRAAQDLRVGYFAQHQMDQLDPSASPLLHLQRLAPNTSEQNLRDFLGGFGFIGDMALAASAPFSGGEKARLALALLVWQKPNLLLLDEPTNHLDLTMRDALALALQDYQGALVVVSHDRYLLRSVCDDFWLVAEGQATPFEGDLEDYRKWLDQQRNASQAPSAERQEKRQHSQAQRGQRRQLENRLKKLEKQIEECSREKAEVEALLADPALYAEREKAALQARRQVELGTKLEGLEMEWLEVTAELEGQAA